MTQTAANHFNVLRFTNAHSILSPVSGFLKEACFTHSLTPARNCSYGCSYCYVPTMRIQAGLKPEDWTHWGQWTTFKQNAPELLAKALRPTQIIYCSPLTDPYQPAEAEARLMPALLEAVAARPPQAFVIQTRGPLILRDLDLLRQAKARVSFSVTTDRDEVRKVFEPRCAPVAERWQTIARLRDAGIPVTVTLAPLLPCDPEALVAQARAVSGGAVIADPLHIKRHGATTRAAALAICRHHGWERWLDPAFQQEVLARMGVPSGPAGFRELTRASRSPIL